MKRPSSNQNQMSLFDLPPPTAGEGAPKEREREAPKPAPTPPLPPAPSDAMPLSDALRLDYNLALRASAGTGKTHNLIALCVHLLAGARRITSRPLPPSELCLLTFTDKAAGELRSRLFKRIDALARGSKDEELEVTLATLGRKGPSTEDWRKIREALGSATIGTFHSLCMQLLRAAPPGAMVSPSFELLDEREARALLEDTVERVVLGELEAQNREVAQLCREHTFGGIVGWMVSCFTQIREEGLTMAMVPVGDQAAARRDFENAIERARKLTLQEIGKTPALSAVLDALSGITLDNFFEGDRYPRIEAAIYKKHLNPELRELLQRYGKSEQLSIRDYCGQCLAIPHEHTARELLTAVEQRYRDTLQRQNALDFTGLLVAARDLLRDVPGARAAAQKRVGALLVDEFQDTNHLQLELCTLLAEKRAGAPRPIGSSHDGGPSGDIERLPLEPGFICVVGDPKQSIYEFRGADVSVFEEMTRRLVRENGARSFLKRSWRTSPELIRFINGACPDVFHVSVSADSRRGYELMYSADEEDLEPVRGSRPGPAVLRLEVEKQETAAERRAAEAKAIARWLAHALTEGPTVTRRGEKEPHRMRGGDVALLFRAFTEVETYRHALVAMGVRHRVVRGRGFFGAQEVVDLASLLALVANPHDALALAGVLRSPLVALSDQTLLSLVTDKWGLDAAKVLRSKEDPPLADGGERERLREFRALHARLHRERDRLGVSGLLKVALEESGYRTAIAAAPFGEQALANLSKLLELAARREAKGSSASAFARELLDLYEREPREAQGDALDESDEDAVTLCTVHQAKGLEWPVVVLPDLGAPPRNATERMLFDRYHGLALRPGDSDDGALASVRHKNVQTERRRRGMAEEQRLLYVAVTRARDLLVLGSLDGIKDSWGQRIGTLLDSSIHGLKAQTEAVDPKALKAEPLHNVVRLEPDADARVAVVETRVLHRPAPSFTRAVLPVTQLQEFDVCPRRYRFLHLVGLAEHLVPLELDEEPDDDDLFDDPKQRGVAVHKLLELTPLEAVGKPGLRQRLEELARTFAVEANEKVFAAVEGFWKTPFGHSVASQGDEKVHRELPFMLRLDDGEGFSLHLKGQIDLLLETPIGSVEVVDYKTSKRPSGGLLPYQFQLGCYALAASKLVEPGTPIRTGIAFLLERQKAPEFDPQPLDVAKLQRRLAQQAKALVTAQQTSKWERKPRSFCEEIGCGYVTRCHGVVDSKGDSA